MTEKELNQLYYLNKETARLQKDLFEMEQWDGYRSPIISGMPRGMVGKDMVDYIAEKVDLQRMISLNLQRIQIERARLERYISSIPDAEIRLIFRLRHINGMKWEDIGAETSMERTTVSKKHRAYLKNFPTNPV